MLTKQQSSKVLDKTPHSPGVYQMIDEKGEVIYIGKAKDLRKRLSQYFKDGYEHSSRTQKLLEKMSDLKYIATDSELEATILEQTQIKELKPKYNVVMKDDKNFVYIKITKEDFPRVQIVRSIEKDNAKYYGPKTAAHKVKETFKILKKIFPFRHCSLDMQLLTSGKVEVTRKTIKYPCLDYYIKRCIAPCISKCSKEQYADIIRNVEKFFDGKADEILKQLNDEMTTQAQNKQFEKAAKTRDKIKKIHEILERQKVSGTEGKSQDIINYFIIHDHAYFNLFQVRDGKLINQENFILTAKEVGEESENIEVLEAFINQYYQIATDIPKEILLPHEVPIEKDLVSAKIIVPQKGDSNKLLQMSLNNAKLFADRNKISWQKESIETKQAAEELQKILKMENLIKRIECYDISHLAGTDTVGSMVVFENGAPKNKDYRKFNIRTVQNKPDDYKSMEEVLYRRLIKIADKITHSKFQFKKATKKDLAKLEKIEDKKEFYVLMDGKEVIGQIGKIEHSKKVAELTGLQINEKYRGQKLGYKLINGIIEKVKSKRVYIICKPELKDYYQCLGFEEIDKLPDEILQHQKECQKSCGEKPVKLVYDKLKHKKDESFEKIPDLIVIDGGKGQLSAADTVLKKLNIQIPHIALAKRMEEIYTIGSQIPIILERNSEALKLLQRARDEAHRFAISHNKQLRSKRIRPQN